MLKEGMFTRTLSVAQNLDSSALVPAQTVYQAVPMAQVSSCASGSGVVDLNYGKPAIELWPKPEVTTVTVKNKNTANAKDVIAYIFNEKALLDTLTQADYAPPAVNADKVEVKYNDGIFGGKLIDRIIEQKNAGAGLLCKGITIMARDENGTASNEAISAMDARVQTYEMINGTPVGQNIDISEAIRNSQFKDGLVTIKRDFVVNALTQFIFNCPKGYSYSLKFEWA